MPTESYLPPIEFPNTDIWGFLFERKDKPYPDDKVIFRDPYTNRSYTFAQVRDTAVEFGKGLKSVYEWRRGHVLALFTPNCIDTPSVMWGAHWAGGIVSPANPGYTAEEFAFQLKDAGARAIVTQKALLPTAIEAAKMVGIEEDHIILMGDEKDDTYKFKHFSNVKNLAGTSRYRRAKLSPDKDIAFLPYSSGTTGKPKGVMLCHRNVTSNTLMNHTLESKNLSWKNDRLIAFLPFFHIYGLTVIIHQSLYAGYECLVMPKFDLPNFCKIIQDHKVTMAYVVPPVVLQLGKHPVVSNYDLTSLRMMNSGAAPLTRELVDAVYKRLKVPVKQGYGLSETSPTTHAQPWDHWDKKMGSAGILLPGQTAKFMSAEETEVPIGETGELWIKGPNVFMGYLNNEEGTKNALTSDGYFKTGDVGFQDKDGAFFITDRVKELIKYKGFQVPPAELEGKLLSHDKVNDVAVIGVYDEQQATEVPRAYVVVNKGIEQNEATSKDIIDWLAQKVANHKRLRGGVRFVEEIPKSVSGKILRRVLKEKAKDDPHQPLKAKL